jgi:VWFA-related protein
MQLVFRSTVDSVSVDVSVRKGNGPVLNLTTADFVVSDNSVPQTIESLSLAAVPIDVTLFLDTSGTTAGSIAQMKTDVLSIAKMLRPDDRLRLLVFADGIRDVFGWRAPSEAVPLETVSTGTVSSPIYDALILAMLRRPAADRRQLIVAITDGQDNGSLLGSAMVRDVARRAEAVMHVVLIGGDKPVAGQAPPAEFAMRSLPDRASESNLDEAATLTGGRLYRAPILSFHDRIINAFQSAFDDFRQSYVLRFSPTGVGRDGWHTIRVQVPAQQGLTIRARRGYFGG